MAKYTNTNNSRYKWPYVHCRVYVYHPRDPQGFKRHRDFGRNFQPKVTTYAALAGPQVPCTTSLYCPKANFLSTQYRTANQIEPTLRVSSNTQARLEQESPIQVVTELKIGELQWSNENCYFQADKLLCPKNGETLLLLFTLADFGTIPIVNGYSICPAPPPPNSKARLPAKHLHYRKRSYDPSSTYI